MTYDVAVIGGGPAGLALAIEAASRGVSTVVLERQAYPVDKACGEGLMPAGVAALTALGVRQRLSPRDATPFAGIRYVQPATDRGAASTGRDVAEARFPGGALGLGIRRVALSQAMVARAREAGAEVRERTLVSGVSVERAAAVVSTGAGELVARLVVAADGLQSPLRARAGLGAAPGLPWRYGIRRHYRLRPWTDLVEVHFAPGVEAYVTPVGEERVGIAFLWTKAQGEEASFEAHLARFPELAARVRGAEPESTVRGAGPLAQPVRGRVADRLALLGDAAGYVDAITGEGLTLAFRAAAALGALLPAALEGGATARALGPYDRQYARLFRNYAALTGSLLWIAARPRLRARVIRALGRSPAVFSQLLRLVG